MLESMEKAAENNVKDYARNVGNNQAIEHGRKVRYYAKLCKGSQELIKKVLKIGSK